MFSKESEKWGKGTTERDSWSGNSEVTRWSLKVVNASQIIYKDISNFVQVDKNITSAGSKRSSDTQIS